MAQTAPPSLDRRPGGRPRPAAESRAAPALVSSGGRQRRWSLALLALLLTVGSGLAFVLLWLNAGDRQPVLAVAHDVIAGQPIERDDLTVVRVSTDPGLAPIPASQRDEIVGQIANVDLRAGTLLVDAAVGGDEGLPPGTAVVPVPLPIEKLPSPDLEAGQTVRVFRTTSADLVDGQGAGAEVLADARVLAVEARESTVTISLSVTAELAPGIVAAAQAEQIYLALVPNA